MERAQAVVDRAREQEAVYEAEVAEGEARYAKLLVEAATVDAPPVVSPQVTELQERVNALVLERDALRAAPVIRGIPKEVQGTWMGDLHRVEDIPPIPTSDMQDLAGWMSQRNCELRNAMEFGDPLLVAKIGSLVGQGASVFSTAVRDLNGGADQVVCDVESDRRGRRETTVCDRRQCEWSAAAMRESRYGFRGVRVGDASNPGPHRTRARARMEEEADAVLSGLEAALTRIDDSSDDEPPMPIWKDEASECEEMGRRADVPNVWARVGDVECRTVVDPESLAGADECSSVRSESCWGETEDIDEHEDVEWGLASTNGAVSRSPGATRCGV